MRQLGGDEAGYVEIQLHGVIDTGNVMEIVDQSPAGAAPKDEALHEAGAEEDQRCQRETSSSG